MKYINETILRELGIDWSALQQVIADATVLLREKKVSQPVKPYLRFNDPVNRIIAMPAYVGGKFDTAGIKWIASFPGNISRAVKRAHSVIILNDATTGIPITLINTALISGIRTAAVSAFVLNRYFMDNDHAGRNAGIIGMGPIGQLHLKMLAHFFKDRFQHIYLYDLKGIKSELYAPYNDEGNITVCDSWEEVYERSDTFITCTVSAGQYVNVQPKKGGVYLNVSLRDFKSSFLQDIDVNIVDNWDEICRENTDIEKAHVEFGLQKEDVREITDIIEPGSLAGLSDNSFMFNPMGMAIYDIAVSRYYHDLAVARHKFVELED